MKEENIKDEIIKELKEVNKRHIEIIKILIIGYIIMFVIFCVSGAIMVSSMWKSYFGTEYGYAEQDISNINTNTIN